MNLFESIENSLLFEENNAEYEYSKYVSEHIYNVNRAYEWIKINTPEILSLSETPIEELDYEIENHDMSKWSPEEFKYYADRWHGSKNETPEYKKAWKHHYMNNPHHPEFWNKQGMPNSKIIELVCDWWSFGWSKNDLFEIFEYFDQNKLEKKEVLTDSDIETISYILNIIKNKLEEKKENGKLLEATSQQVKKAYKESKKNAVDAIVVSRARHLVDNDIKQTEDTENAQKLIYIRNKLSKEKIENLVNMVDYADETEGAVDIDIHDDIGHTKSITADFESDGHMSLHVIRGSHKKLDQNREGRQQSTGYGENDKFIKDTTGKNIKDLARKKYDAEKRKNGLRESEFSDDLINLFGNALENDTTSSYEYISEDENAYRENLKNKGFSDKQIFRILQKTNGGSNKSNDTPKKPREKQLTSNWADENNKSLYKTINGEKYILTDSGKYEKITESINLFNKYMPENVNEDYNELFNEAIYILYESLDGSYKQPIETCLSLDILPDILSEIKDIKYGFIDKNTGERREDREWIHNCPNLGHYYETNFDPEITLKNKLGICLDQSIAIKHLFNKLYPEYECKIMAITKGRFGHAVPIYRHTGDESGNEWYYLENAWDKERGLHGGFKSEEDVRKYLEYIYHKHHDKDNDDPVVVQTYEEFVNGGTLNESFLRD